MKKAFLITAAIAAIAAIAVLVLAGADAPTTTQKQKTTVECTSNYVPGLGYKLECAD